MSSTNDDATIPEPSQPDDELAWWEEFFRLDGVEGGPEPFLEVTAGVVADIPVAGNGDVAPDHSESPQSPGCEPGGRRSLGRDRKGYTLEKANELAATLRSLPERDPSHRRLDKQMVVRHLVEEIMALRQRGYTLEQVAALLSAEGLELTPPTLKSYLQRIRMGARRASARAGLPLVLGRGSR